MPRIIQLLEIDLNGSTFRIQLGGSVALTENDTPVAVVRVDTLEEAGRLETVAALCHFTFRWKENHGQLRIIDVKELEQWLASDPSRFIQPGARDRFAALGIAVPVQAVPTTPRKRSEQESCPGCGATEGAFFGDYCGGCAFVDNNPHGHDD